MGAAGHRVHGVEHLRSALRDGHGVLITPNHATHYDSNSLYLAADKIGTPLYYMTAWQVFGTPALFPMSRTDHAALHHIVAEQIMQCFGQLRVPGHIDAEICGALLMGGVNQSLHSAMTRERKMSQERLIVELQCFMRRVLCIDDREEKA